MNILVTAGNTQTLIDKVRCITNIFTGKTGAQIAATAYERGHSVMLLTSNPEVTEAIPATRPRTFPAWQVGHYRTFEALEALMAEELTTNTYDAVIHSAAVSDYHVSGILAPASGTAFLPGERAWETTTGGKPTMVDTTAGKVKSSHPELWLRLVPTAKLVDKIRTVWGFKGVLVKFKLEVGVSEAELLDIAEKSRVHSAADLMAANTLEGRFDWAILGAGRDGYRRLKRDDLAGALLDAVEDASAMRR